MSARVRFLMSLGLTFVLVGAGVVTWGNRTGQFTIFGDSNQTINADLAVTSTVDLQKGVAAGDHQLNVTPDGLGLADGQLAGTAVFTLGQREIVSIDRVVPILTQPIPSHSQIALAVAGSTDGVSFNPYSPAQTASVTATAPTGQPIELGFLIPTDSRFIRVKLTMTRTDPTDQPHLAGFTINYSQLAPATTGAADETVLVNGAPLNETSAAPTPGRPNQLAVTGGDGWLLGITIAWLFGLWLIWSTRGSRGLKGGHGRTTISG